MCYLPPPGHPTEVLRVARLPRRATAALLQPPAADDCPECRAILAGQWIRTRRGDTSQAALAQRIGVAANTIARYERGEMAVPLTVLLAIKAVC